MNNNNEFQKQRIKLNFSLQICEKVLDDFSNIHYIEKILKNCDINCYDKYKEIYDKNLNNPTFDYGNFKGDLDNCEKKCEDMYKQIVDHQKKGAEISYYTYQKHLKKCKDLSGQDMEKLLNCYNLKVDKISKRFGSYYFNQRINLMNRIMNKKEN